VRQLLEIAVVLVISPLALVEDGTQQKPAPKPVAIENGRAAVSPENTTIEFTGLHSGAEPNPRVGYFTSFKGELTFDENKMLTGGDVEIDTGSLTTPIQKLSQHLKSPDFFDVRQYPKATFKVTKVEPTPIASAPTSKVTGDLTIRDQTKPVTFPAIVRSNGDGSFTLESKFDIERSKFGMTFGPDRVVDKVTIIVHVGRKTPSIKSE
jgi:polyisoprenoid-binding protein YceI